MVEPSKPGDVPAISNCPWCSASLTPGVATCPSCGANLTADDPADVPGLTAVDALAVGRNRAPPTQRRGILSWISGEYSDDSLDPAEAQAIAPPDVEVRREILRLELEARVAQLQADTDAMLSEAAGEGRTVEIPDGLRQYASADLVEAIDAYNAEVATDHASADPPATEATADAQGDDATGAPAAAVVDPAASDDGAEAASTDDSGTDDEGTPAG